MLLRNQTLAEIVRQDFRAAAVFQKYGLDFCCGGTRNLDQACATAELKPEDVLSEIQLKTLSETSLNPIQIFVQLPIEVLCEYIVSNYHAFVRNSVPEIGKYLNKIADKHGARIPRYKDLFQEFNKGTEALVQHLSNEEQELFQYIKRLAKLRKLQSTDSLDSSDSVTTSILELEKEHQEAKEYLFAIRTLTNNYTPPKDACTTVQIAYRELKRFDENLQEHVFIENHILFPRAIELEKEIISLKSQRIKK